MAWDVALIMADPRDPQVEVSFGGLVGFRMEALTAVMDVLVPSTRRREVFEKWQLIKPYALQALRGKG